MSDHFSDHQRCCDDEKYETPHVCRYCSKSWPCLTEQTKRQVVTKVLEIVERGSSPVERSIATEIKEL